MSDVLPILPAIQTHPQPEEDRCRRCGMSCHPAIRIGKRAVIIPELHCRFLTRDPHSGLASCRVYARRFELAPWCLSAGQAAGMGALAHDCPYTTEGHGFNGKRWAAGHERQAVAETVRQGLIDDGLCLADSPDSALSLLNTGCEEWTYSLSPDESKFIFHRIA